MPHFTVIHAILTGYGLASVVTFIVYGLDKRRAVRGRRRIRERTLHTFELLGGWPGALAAQAFFRHKLRKTSYMLGFALIVAVHLAAWLAWYRFAPPAAS